MNIPNWLKPGIYGAAVGAVVVAIGGFTWGGWVTGSKAEAIASNRAQEQVVAAMIPFCVALSEADPAITEKLANLKKASAYQRAEVLMKTGWATMPGSTDPDRALAKACAVELIAEL